MSKVGTFNYPGGKTTIANWIIDHIPEHHLYVEPFGGAASVLVAKPRSEIEVYNDINGDCVDFFRAVRDRPDELEHWVKNTPYSRELFEEYVESYPEWPDDLVERAGRFCYTQIAAFGGEGVTVGDQAFKVAKSGSGENVCANHWSSKAAHIKPLSERFRNVNIEHLDYAKLVEKYDHEDAFFYFDPPYVDVGDDYYQTESGGFDHSRFVNLLHDIDGKWLVSYDQNIPPGLEDYRTVSRTKVAIMSPQTPEKVETLTINYDVNGEAVMSEYGQQTLTEVGD